MVRNRDHNLGADVQGTLQQQIVSAMYRTGETILDGCRRAVRQVVTDGGKHFLKRPAGHESHCLPEQLDRRLFAERTALPLESDARILLCTRHPRPSLRSASCIWAVAA